MTVCVKKFTCTNVGELRQALHGLDGEIRIECGFEEGVVVWHGSESYSEGMTKAQVKKLPIGVCMLMTAD